MDDSIKVIQYHEDMIMNISISLQNKMKAFQRQNGLCARCAKSLSFSQQKENSAQMVCVNTDKDQKKAEQSFLMSNENCIYLCELCIKTFDQKICANHIQELRYSHGNNENSQEGHLNWQKKIIPLLSQNTNIDRNAQEEMNRFNRISVKTSDSNSTQKGTVHKKIGATKRSIKIGNFKKEKQQEKKQYERPVRDNKTAKKNNQPRVKEFVKHQTKEVQISKTNTNKATAFSYKDESIKQKPSELNKINHTFEANLSPEKAKMVEYRRLLQSKLRKLAKKAYR